MPAADYVAFTPHEEADVAKLILRRDQLAKFRRLAGIDTLEEFARRIDMHPTQVSRVLNGRTSPGTRFIAGVLNLFGIECFADLFAVVPDDDGDGEAA